jgi:hypothetical protein
MAGSAIDGPGRAPEEAGLEDPEPGDLIVNSPTRAPESHLNRSHKHDTEHDDWSEAERVIREDMARQRRTVT